MSTQQIMLFAVPPSKMRRLNMAQAIAGTLGKPSKMPGRSYGISAKLCKVGAKLAKIAGSVCHGCYALKSNYSYPSVQQAHATRAAGLSSVSWRAAMIKLISHADDPWFRWHDAGDLQNLQHLFDIVAIAEALPSVNFWLPTREAGLIKRYLAAFGDFPPNLCVRVSAAMIDGRPPSGFGNTSTVLTAGATCPAPHQGNKCLDCRQCWSRDVVNVSYRVH